MDEKFIEWPDYAVCPKCKRKVETPLKLDLFKIAPKNRSMTCPFCKAEIKYIPYLTKTDTILTTE